jgi:hypothetical protein
MIKYVIITAVLCSGCTDAMMGKFKSLGNSARVRCWSGGQLIVDTVSSGKISSEANSNGYYFVEKSSGDVIEVDADCIFRYTK